MRILILLGLAFLIADDPVEVDLWKITSIEYEEGKELPEEIRELDGKEVEISGFMHQDTEADGVTTFLLVTDACGCDGAPKVQHFVQVTLKEGDTGYTSESIKITGTLSVSEVKEDDIVVSLYRLKADSIEED